MNSFYHVMDNGGMFLADNEVEQLKQATETFGANYMLLRQMARNNGRLWWQVRPKHDKMQHFPKLAKIFNPKYVQCYSEESLVGTCIKIWKGSMAGRYQKHVQISALHKKLHL